MSLFPDFLLFAAVICGGTEKPSPCHAPGEPMRFHVVAGGTNILSSCELVWKRTGDDGHMEFGRAPADRPFDYQTSLDRPGFVRLYVELVLSDAKADSKARPLATADLGAGCDVLKIRQAVPAPSDFDAFWAGRKALLASVIWRGREKVEEIPSPVDALRLFKVSVPCAGARPVTGYLSVPRVAAKYPAVVFYHGYGSSFSPDFTQAPTAKFLSPHLNEVFFSCSAHGFELGRENSYYEAWREGLKSNGHRHGFDDVQNADPLKPYYHDMALRAARAVEFVKSRSEWNGKFLRVTGGSQGGLQSIWAAALVPGVSELNVTIPWNCDIGGTTLGRNRGTWYVNWVPALGYYDCCNFAPRIPASCRVRIALAGLGDYVCPPTGVMSFYNALRHTKSIVLVQNTEHGPRLEPKPDSYAFSGSEFIEGGKK